MGSSRRQLRDQLRGDPRGSCGMSHEVMLRGRFGILISLKGKSRLSLPVFLLHMPPQLTPYIQVHHVLKVLSLRDSFRLAIGVVDSSVNELLLRKSTTCFSESILIGVHLRARSSLNTASYDEHAAHADQHLLRGISLER